MSASVPALPVEVAPRVALHRWLYDVVQAAQCQRTVRVRPVRVTPDPTRLAMECTPPPRGRAMHRLLTHVSLHNLPPPAA